jgi:hypothetical protein
MYAKGRRPARSHDRPQIEISEVLVLLNLITGDRQDLDDRHLRSPSGAMVTVRTTVP